MSALGSDAASLPPRLFASYATSDGGEIGLRAPTAADGPAVTALIAQCPPLDSNSAYCNLLQCSHFADTCIVAESAGAIVGWLSGYRPPSDPDVFFVWQVAISPVARGQKLASKLLGAVLQRPAALGVTRVETTVTHDNAASWGLFESFARRIDAKLTRTSMFDRDTHFNGAHDTEWLATISPLPVLPLHPQHLETL